MCDKGEELWRYISSDILENWNVVGDHLLLTCTDAGPPMVLSLTNGEMVAS